MEIFFSNNAPKGVFAQYIQRTRFKKAGSYLADDVFGLEQQDVSTAQQKNYMKDYILPSADCFDIHYLEEREKNWGGASAL